MNPIIKFDPDFEINRFFNDLNVRIIGSLESPLFYASDIADVLKIGDNVRRIVSEYDETEIVTDEMKRKYNIVTYRNDGTPHKNMIILTLWGAIRMMITQKCDVSFQLKLWLINTVNTARLNEKTKTKFTNEEHLAKIGELETLIDKYKSENEISKVRKEQIYVFKIKRNLSIIGDDGLHSDDEDSTDVDIRENDEENMIDDIDGYNSMIAKYPNMKPSDYFYKITANPSFNDITKYDRVYADFVVDANKVLDNVRKELRREIVDCMQDNIYDCDLTKIKLIIIRLAASE